MHTKAIEQDNTPLSVPPVQRLAWWHANTSLRNRHIPELRVVEDEWVLSEVRRLRIQKLRPQYPRMDFVTDPLDFQSLILYTSDKNGVVKSTARLSFEGVNPLPEARFLTAYQQRGLRLCEWGRFAIDEGNLPLLKSYYRAMYLLATSMGCDAIVMAMKPRNIRLHRKLVNLQVVEPDMKITYGGKHSLACVLWVLENTGDRFFDWIGGKL